MYDSFLSRKIIEVTLLKQGFSLSAIKEMTEKEVLEYLVIISSMNELEIEKMEQNYG